MMNNLLKLPTPSSISYMWNFGSILGLSLSMQIITGLLLSIHFSADLGLAFSSMVHINNNVNNGYLIRFTHANGATAFFICLYLHISRGIYYKSFNKSPLTWVSGVLSFLLFMGVAFLGYVLPWGQMSFWGATVITNLISVIPYLGSDLVEWVWGGFSVGGPTLSRFYTFHFLFPLGGVVLILLHLIFLHETGSSNPLGLMKSTDKVSFHPFFSVKDVLGFLLFVLMVMYVTLHVPLLFMDSDNFIEANPMITPMHIQPEWYFLFAYAILRSIPSKLGGVMGLLLSVCILLLAPLMVSQKYYNNLQDKCACMALFFSFTLLTYFGSLPVMDPYSTLSAYISGFYFMSMGLLV